VADEKGAAASEGVILLSIDDVEGCPLGFNLASSGQAASAAQLRNPSKGAAFYDGFRRSASLRPE
jgi:hypothetical protein